jgi:prepilin-type processing-associated H-X9-DG protein/prepilin-type N-terminal cleavage/methylation domain-containing protein
MSPRSVFRRKIPAFTLVELLTVIAVIGILAAILIPTVGRVRSAARASQCISNLRQTGAATNLFVNENRGRLPRQNFQFPHDLWPYVASTAQALPSIAGDPPPDLAGTVFECPNVYDDEQTTKRSYGYNSRILPRGVTAAQLPSDPLAGSGSNAKIKMLSHIENLSQTLLYADAKGTSLFGNTGNMDTAIGQLNPRHSGRINVSFADGSVRPIGVETIPTSYDTPFWRGH